MELIKAYIDRIVPLDDSEWKAFIRLFREINVRKNEFFSEEGKATLELGLLLDGVCCSYNRNGEGENCSDFFVARHWMGSYTSLLSSLPSDMTIQALTDCRMLVADLSSLGLLYEKYPRIALLIHALSEQQVIVKEKREKAMAGMNADQRYLSFMKHYPMLESLASEQQIASFLNISVSQLSSVKSMTLMVGW